MAQAARHGHANPLSLFSLALADGKAHPVEGLFAVATIVLGAVSAITAFWSGLHVISAWTGLVGVLVGARGQFISATTGERFVLIIGLGAAGIGFYLGMMHGGLLA
jgi:hypothetical protein